MHLRSQSHPAPLFPIFELMFQLKGSFRPVISPQSRGIDLRIRRSFFQLLSFMESSKTSWRWDIDMTWVSPEIRSSLDHNVSIISPSTCADPSMKLSENFAKHSWIWAAR